MQICCASILFPSSLRLHLRPPPSPAPFLSPRVLLMRWSHVRVQPLQPTAGWEPGSSSHTLIPTCAAHSTCPSAALTSRRSKEPTSATTVPLNQSRPRKAPHLCASGSTIDPTRVHGAWLERREQQQQQQHDALALTAAISAEQICSGTMDLSGSQGDAANISSALPSKCNIAPVVVNTCHSPPPTICAIRSAMCAVIPPPPCSVQMPLQLFVRSSRMEA